ncbi:MAG: RNA polymerase factor sigma-54 [Candidatus Cryptobacteroides sp.]
MATINQGLELKQKQKLSPLQIQTIHLIELPIQELEQKIRSEMDNNPVLDDSPVQDKDENSDDPKDVSIDESMDSDGEIPDYKLHVNNFGKDDNRSQTNIMSFKESFTQSLMEQLGYRHLSQEEYNIAAFLIGSLDGDGYLRRDIESIVDDLAFKASIDTDEQQVLDLLKVIQDFEPSGVGARNLQECLLIQLNAQNKTSRSKETEDAIRVIRDYFKDFSNKHFDRIMNRLSLSKKEMRAVIDRIVKLNPSPGGQIDDSYNDKVQQIVPDFALTIEDGEFKLTMPRFTVPEIRVNKKYAQLLKDTGDSSCRQQKEAAAFVKQKIDSAKWFVEALKQRQNTLESTMKAILAYQHDYFVDGDETHLKPMVLKDIAEITGFDISTISRVVSSKYIETHFGIFPLKFFFSEGLENKEGEEVSTRELKKALREIVDAEDKLKPLTDDQLVSMMNEKGYKVARRTIAKYRNQLDIPKASQRKSI